MSRRLKREKAAEEKRNKSLLTQLAEERGMVYDADSLYYDGYESYGYSKYYQGGSSASSYWSSRFNYGGSGYSYSNQTERFFDILNTITRSANIVENARVELENGVERRFQCRWSDGKSVNKVQEDAIFLPPNVVVKEHSLKTEWSEEQQTDVLIGQAMTEAGIKTTTSIEGQERIEKNTVNAEEAKANAEAEMARTGEEFKAFEDAFNRCKELGMPETKKVEARLQLLRHHDEQLKKKVADAEMQKVATEMADHIWYAAEVLAAQKGILGTYPGFKPYFAAQTEYYTHEPFKQEMTEALGAGTKAAKLAENIVVWQMVHPDMPMDSLPGEYEEAVDFSMDRLEKATTSQERAEAALDIARDLLRRFPEDWQSQKQPTHGDGNGLPQKNFKGTVVNDVNAELAHVRANEDKGKPGGMGREEGTDYDKNVKNVNVTGNFEASLQGYCRQLNPQIQALRNRLKLRNEIPTVREHGLKHGQLDEGSLYKLGFHKTGFNDNRVFEEKCVITHPELAVAILIDESGSMGGHDGPSGNPKYEEAKKLAIITAMALLGLEGVALSILGHTAEGHGYGGAANGNGIILHHYLTPENNNVGAITEISSYCNNIDGYAIQETTRRMISWHPNAKSRMLIHVSDGQPAGRGYGGMPAMQHMQRVREYARRNNVMVFGIGVGGEFTREKCDLMYGTGRWAKVEMMTQAGIIISNLISKEIRRAAAL